jgi:hypothetical protein
MGITVQPAEADAVLAIDSNAVLTCPVAHKRLEHISRWRSEIVQAVRRIDESHLAFDNVS